MNICVKCWNTESSYDLRDSDVRLSAVVADEIAATLVRARCKLLLIKRRI